MNFSLREFYDFISACFLQCVVAWLGAIQSSPVRLSPTSYPYHYPNPKWVVHSENTSSNRVPKASRHFAYEERGEANMRRPTPRPKPAPSSMVGP